MSERKTAGPGGSEGARRATGEAPGPGAQKSRREFRMSAGRKQAAVLRLLQGEDLETLSRELRVTGAELSGWRAAFLAAGSNGLRARSTRSGVIGICQMPHPLPAQWRWRRRPRGPRRRRAPRRVR